MPGAVPSSLPFTAIQVRSLLAALGKYPGVVRERGRRLFDDGHARLIGAPLPLIQVEVKASKTFTVQWEPVGGDWRNECTCPTAIDCEHAYAAARALVDRCPPGVIAEVRRLAGLRNEPAAPAPAPAVPKRAASAKKRNLEALFGKGQSLTDRHISLRYLLAQAAMPEIDPYDAGFAEILQENDVALLCYGLADRIAALSGGPLPPELEPFRARPDLVEARDERRRSALASELRRWAESVDASPQRSLRFLWRLALNAANRAELSVEVRVTSARLRDELRTVTQLRQLRTDAQVSPGTLNALHLSLLDVYLEATEASENPYSIIAGNDLTLHMLRLAEGSDALAWSEDCDPELAERAGIVPGESLRLSAGTAQVLPAVDGDGGEIRFELQCYWPDNASAPARSVVSIDDPTSRVPLLLLAKGEVTPATHLPPVEIRKRFEELGELRLPLEEGRELVQALAPRFPPVERTLRQRSRVYPVQVVVGLDLRDDDWLQIRMFARGENAGDWRPGHPLPPGSIVFEYGPDERWRRFVESAEKEDGDFGPMAAPSSDVPPGEAPTPEPAPQQADVEAWIEVPDADAVAPGLGWLEAIGAHPGIRRNRAGYATRAADREFGWWLELNARRMATFVEVWDERPAAVQFFGTPRLRRLFVGAPRAKARVRVLKSGVDWFAVSAEWEAEGMQLSEEDIARLQASRDRFVRLESGWVRRDVVDGHDEMAELLADLGISADGDEQRVTLWQLATASPESLAAMSDLGLDDDTMQQLDELRARVAAFNGIPQTSVPGGITAEMRPYQRAGLDFLSYTADLGLGSVLADDMGLGKTLQALAWLEHLRQQAPDGGPSLVVCPTSVMHNWQREAERFAPGMKVLLLEAGEERHELRQQIANYDLAITNYSLLRRDIEEWRDIELRAAILDEAQNIKNPDAAVSQAAFELKARHRLALTGTPLENRPLDVWSILNFVNPGYLGRRSEFTARHDRLDIGPHSRTLLAAKLRPVLLRRMKKEVAQDLPDRIEERLDCELTPGQRQLYLAELNRSRRLLDELTTEPEGVRRNQISILAALTRLRQICCHPSLVDAEDGLGSGKFDALFELLEPLLAEGHKVLLFSQFVQCLDRIAVEMRQRDIAFHKLTGETTRREEVVEAFRNDDRASVFLISLRAGGTGLNLTAASYVVLFDPWWNPAVEAQAIDRTHRIGQDRTVIAYRLVTRGTIEEKILDLHQRKSTLVQEILGDSGVGQSLSRADLEYLFADPE